MSDSDSTEDEKHTMVVTLGSRMIKAGYAGEKTCRYVSNQVHVSSTECPDLLHPTEETIPLLDTKNETINQKSALITALRKCWSEQYSPKLSPCETRLALVVPTRSPTLLNEIAEIVFPELKVESLCVMTPGESVTVIEDGENSVVIDIGYEETRVETFVNWRLVDRVVIALGGRAAESFSNDEDARNAVFSGDTEGLSIPDVLKRSLEMYDAVSRVIVVGSTSFRFHKEYLESKCGVSFKGRNIRYSLVPERNKSEWLGASIVPDIKLCHHRFHSASEWCEKGSIYIPLFLQSPPI